jgi:hypothetical protein
MQATRIGTAAVVVGCCGHYHISHPDSEPGRFRIPNLVPDYGYMAGRSADNTFWKALAATVVHPWRFGVCSGPGYAFRQFSSTCLKCGENECR